MLVAKAKAKDQGHNAEVFSKKERSSPKNSQMFRKMQAISKTKVFAQKLANFPHNSSVFEKKRYSKVCRKFSGVLQDETTLLMTLAHFQQVKK